MLNLNIYRKKLVGMADWLNTAAVVQDGVMLNKDGSLMAMFRARGPDRNAVGTLMLEVLANKVAQSLRLEEGFMVHHDASGVPASSYSDCEYSHPVPALLDTVRRRRYTREGAHFERESVLTLTYMPPGGVEGKLAQRFVIEEQDDSDGKHIAGAPAGTLTKFVDQALAFASAFSGGAIHLEQLNSHEMFSHMAYCITGERYKLKLPSLAMYLDVALATDITPGFDLRVGEKRVSVISFNGFPRFTTEGLLDRLAAYPAEFRWSTRFIPLSQNTAISVLEDIEKDWGRNKVGLKKANGDAFDQSADSESALNRVRSGEVTVGYWNSHVVVYHDSPKQLREIVGELQKTLGTIDQLKTVKEGFNTFQAYKSTLPGHSVPNARRILVTNETVADLLPLSQAWAGYIKNPGEFYPDNSPPLLWAATDGYTPFRPCINGGTSPHAMVLGPSGSGKSTLLALLASSHFRYYGSQKAHAAKHNQPLRPPKVVAFDKGYSLYALCKAMNGAHFDIGGERQTLSFYPLANINESAKEMSWAQDWLETLAQLQGYTPTQADKGALASALQLLAASDDDSRTLTNLVGQLPPGEFSEALGSYTLTGGAAGQMLDAQTDSIRDAEFLVFELEHLMGYSNTQVVPVLLYLFHAIERQFNGEPRLFLIDEAWLALSHPLFREKIKEWLKVLRKLNVSVVFATQSINDVVKSPIADTLIEQCQTVILLANEKATQGPSRAPYEMLGLSDEQIAVVANMTPKQDYLFMSPAGKRVMSLGLKKGGPELAFYGASGPDDLAAIRRLEVEHGDKWVEAWLRHKGLEEFATYYEWLRRQPAFTNKDPNGDAQDLRERRLRLLKDLQAVEAELAAR